MGEAAASGDGINPNVPVTGEGKSESKSNSDVSWDDVAEVTETRGKKKGGKPEHRESAPKKAKDSGTGFDDAEDEGEDRDEAAAKSKKGEGADDGERRAEKGAKEGAEKEAPKKAKVHKFRSGDAEHDLSGDAVVTVPIDGKKEDVPLQELVNNYSGKVAWDRRFNDLAEKEKGHTTRSEELNKLVSGLHERASKDPETAWDFIADWTGQDPVSLKEKVLRDQIKEILPLARMTDQQREAWIQDQKRNWRDRAHSNREAAMKAKETEGRARAERDDAQKTYGIDDKGFDQARDQLTRYLKAKDPQFDTGKLKTQDIVYAHRNLMALDVIKDAVPELAKHEKFDSIVSDITQDLVRHPSITREKLGNQLREVFGGDNSRLKNLGRKAQRANETEVERRSPGRSEQRTRSSSDAVTFDDL